MKSCAKCGCEISDVEACCPGCMSAVTVQDYNPVQCLQEEVARFKATNKFTPMDVTGFYIQAAVVLDYLDDVEETLNQMMRSAEYVLAHRYGSGDPVGSRIVAISDLNGALGHAKRMHRWPNKEASYGAPF